MECIRKPVSTLTESFTGENESVKEKKGEWVFVQKVVRGLCYSLFTMVLVLQLLLLLITHAANEPTGLRKCAGLGVRLTANISVKL